MWKILIIRHLTSGTSVVLKNRWLDLGIYFYFFFPEEYKRNLTVLEWNLTSDYRTEVNDVENINNQTFNWIDKVKFFWNTRKKVSSFGNDNASAHFIKQRIHAILLPQRYNKVRLINGIK